LTKSLPVGFCPLRGPSRPEGGPTGRTRQFPLAGRVVRGLTAYSGLATLRSLTRVEARALKSRRPQEADPDSGRRERESPPKPAPGLPREPAGPSDNI
jgi:hypothetical protein